jgi:hypothetical protein
VAVASAEAEVADVTKQGNVPVVVGDKRVVFSRCQIGGRKLMVAGGVVLPVGKALAPGWEVKVGLYDASGQTVATAWAEPGFVANFTGVIRGPIRAVVSVPVKLREVEVPFELKEVGLW